MITTETRGPVFDGKALVLSEKAVTAAEEAIASRARDAVKDVLGGSIRVHGSGAEVSSFHTERTSTLSTIVTDSHGVAYGPWLEGTGSRNSKTRFKGYFSARRATSEVNSHATDIAETVIQPFVREMS